VLLRQHTSTVAVLRQHTSTVAVLWQHTGTVAVLWQHTGTVAVLWQHTGTVAVLWQHTGTVAVLWQHTSRLCAQLQRWLPLTASWLTSGSPPLPSASQDFPLALLAVGTWLRFSAARQLVWNRNYNIKPREISQAQNKLGDRLAHIWTSR
jgi:hypothetical protein